MRTGGALDLCRRLPSVIRWHGSPVGRPRVTRVVRCPPGVRQVSGEFNMGSQYHFTMETQTTRAVPRDDDQLDLFSSTQHIREVNFVVSQITKLPMHK